MPHARVTVTPVGGNVEIEVWPKAGQSAYAVVDPTVALLIAQALVEVVAPHLDPGEDLEPAPGAEATPGGTVPDNVVDLASRRPTRGRAS